MKVCVIGTGYVGLVAAAGFQEWGHSVSCYDIDAARIDRLRRGEIPIYEPRLAPMLERVEFTASLPQAVGGAHAIILAVGTPSREDGSADLSQVFSAAVAVAESLTGPAVVLVKSTVPVGTCDQVERRIREYSPQIIDVVSNPEFLQEGRAVTDFLEPQRVVLGVLSSSLEGCLRELYRGVPPEKLLFMGRRSAELAKYAANAMLATRISFMNEVANLCECVGGDVVEIQRVLATDPRIGPLFLRPGPGFGGSCFPKDLLALVHTGEVAGAPMTLAEAVVRVNLRQRLVLMKKVFNYFAGELRGRRIAIWGLSFKPETDDIREAPSIVLINELLQCGAEVSVTDPQAIPYVWEIFSDRIKYYRDPYECARGAEALVLVTEWAQYKEPDRGKLRELMKLPVVFDGRNLWGRYYWELFDFIYHGLGRPGSLESSAVEVSAPSYKVP